MRWFIYLLLLFPCMVLCYLTNWIVVLFADENGELPGFLRLWQTWDDSIDSEDCVVYYVPKRIKYDFYKHYRVEYETMQIYNRTRKRSINICPLTMKERVKRYCCRVFWLYRNCAYGFAFYWFGCTVSDKDIQIIKDEYRDGGYVRLYKAGKYWKYYNSSRIFGKWYWKIYIGWKIAGDIKGTHRAMIANRIWVYHNR